MQTLLNLAGVSLLVWGTRIVRVDILRLFGGSLRPDPVPASGA